MKTFLTALPTILLLLLCSPWPVLAQDAGKPGGGEIKELKEVPAALPHDVLLGLLNNAGKETAATKGTDVLHEKVMGRMATLKLKIDRIEKDPREGQPEDAYRIKAEDTHVREGAVNFKIYLWVHFNLSENAKVAALKKGGEIEVTGKVIVAAIHDGKSPEINVDLSEATVH